MSFQEHFLSKDSVKFSFSSEHQPALYVNPGDRIRLQTWDCYMGQVTKPEHNASTYDRAFINGATGPIFVNGVQPGDTLSVTLEEINPGPVGAAMLSPGEGQLHDLVKAPYTRIIRVEDGMVHLNENVSWPMAPMVGVIGVAPKEGEIGTLPAGKHGGNLDNNMNKPGSIVHLPVWHEGGLLGIGDMHASMGDGEICGTGVEIGGEVVITVDVIKGHFSQWPVTETEDSWITHGVAENDLTLALKHACVEAANILVDQWGFTYEDAFIFLSVRGDLGIAQAVHPSSGTVIAKMRVPKIAACPSPVRR